MTSLCRDCFTWATEAIQRCPRCLGRRIVSHPELEKLSIAHIDCDAFYASVEKRDRPELQDKPVIVGGAQRGVVSAACYIARLSGVRSAMPMFKAKKLCPKAVVIKPDMRKYSEVGRAIRTLMLETTPLVEPLSIDEAFLDLSGTEALHRGPPAETLARLALKIEQEQRVTVSIGLSHNKFLAKIASDLDKPRGFAVLGKADAPAFLAAKPVGLIWGVGKAFQASLAKDGIRLIGDLLALDEKTLTQRYGQMGQRLFSLARGQDSRPVDPGGEAKSISAETTFNFDLSDREALAKELWPLCETVAYRLKKAGLSGGGITLKLKTSDFQILTRSRKLGDPTQLAEVIYQAALPLLHKEASGRRFRLIGVGCHELLAGEDADPPELLESGRSKAKKVEAAIDAVRAKLGKDSIAKGRGFRPQSRKPQQPGEA